MTDTLELRRELAVKTYQANHKPTDTGLTAYRKPLLLGKAAASGLAEIVRVMDNAGAKFPNQFNRDCFLSDVAFGLECIHDMGRRDGRFEQLEAIRQMTILAQINAYEGEL